MAFPDTLALDGRDAIVLRGYSVDRPIPRILQENMKEADKPTPLFEVKGGQDVQALVKTKLKDDKRKRLYLSPWFDRYVDYAESDVITSSTPTPDDKSVVLWLRPDRDYWIVTETRLDPPNGYLRGDLVQDFLGHSDFDSPWDEQSPRGGTKKKTGPTCYS